MEIWTILPESLFHIFHTHSIVKTPTGYTLSFIMQVTELIIVNYKQVVLYYLNLFHFSWHINLMFCKKINIKYHWYQILLLSSTFLNWTTLRQMNKLVTNLSFINLASLLKKTPEAKSPCVMFATGESSPQLFYLGD